MARTDAQMRRTATYKGRRIIKGRLFVLVASGSRQELAPRAKGIRRQGFNARIMPSKYYVDWELWRSALSNKTFRERRAIPNQVGGLR
jgi:hypothetical protein